jgi:hypothetical protein
LNALAPCVNLCWPGLATSWGSSFTFNETETDGN